MRNKLKCALYRVAERVTTAEEADSWEHWAEAWVQRKLEWQAQDEERINIHLPLGMCEQILLPEVGEDFQEVWVEKKETYNQNNKQQKQHKQKKKLSNNAQSRKCDFVGSMSGLYYVTVLHKHTVRDININNVMKKWTELKTLEAEPVKINN